MSKNNTGSNVALGILGGLGIIGLGVAAAKNPEAAASILKAFEGPPPPSAEELAKDARRREIREIEDQLLESSKTRIFTPDWVSEAQNLLDKARVEEDADQSDLLIIKARRLVSGSGFRVW